MPTPLKASNEYALSLTWFYCGLEKLVYFLASCRDILGPHHDDKITVSCALPI